MSEEKKEALKREWQAELDAGTTKLTYNEWAARKIMSEAQAKNGNGKVVDKDTHISTKKKPKQSTTVKAPSKGAKPKSKNKPDFLPHDGPLLDEKGKSTLAKPVLPPPPPLPSADDRIVLASGLTSRQEMFCREFIACNYNATQAAKNAGYSDKTARSIGSENLTKPDIQRFLAALHKPKLEALDVSADWILNEYAKMARSNLGHFLRRNEDGTIHTVDGLPSYDFTEVTDDQLVGLSGLEVIILPSMGEDEPNPLKVKVKLTDKKGALDVLAKRAGLLKEYVEHSGEVKIKGDAKDLAMRVAFLLRSAGGRDKKEE